jgi:tRNA pseudouridine38-40 synthase
LSAPREVSRYRARLSYVGTRFHGWQRQRNAPRTVQAALEDALSAIDGGPVRVTAAGRTDAGVHAEGQVVHFDLTRPRETERLRGAANALLPDDARVMEVAAAPASFHARRDALWKEYVYCWSRARVVPPRGAPFVAPLSRNADLERMRRSAALLTGRRDFGVFGVRLPHGESSVRHLHFVRIDEAGDLVRARFRGDAFLRGMVRSIAGLFADVARGRVPPERARELLETGDRRLLSPKAPARGLTLSRVRYPGDPERDGGGDGPETDNGVRSHYTAVG